MFFRFFFNTTLANFTLSTFAVLYIQTVHTHNVYISLLVYVSYFLYLLSPSNIRVFDI